MTRIVPSQRSGLPPLLRLFMFALSMTACTESAPVEPAPTFTGRWQLQAVNDAPLPRVFQITLGNIRRSVIAGEIVVRSRGRLDDIKRTVAENSGGVRLEDFSDTLTSPFSTSGAQLFIRRYAIRAEDAWVDTGTVVDGSLRLRVRLLEPRFGQQRDVTLTYVRSP